MEMIQQSRSQLVNYPNCPWWALKQFRGRPVSVVGRVVFVEQDYIILELDPREKKELKVTIDPYHFKYCFSDKQFNRLKSSNSYNEFRNFLHPAKTHPTASQQMEETSLAKAEEQQPWKLINGHFFKLGSVFEVRGTCSEPSVLKLEQFTAMDNDLDLARYNRMLEAITERMPDLYY